MVRQIQISISEKMVDAIEIAIQAGYAKSLANFGEKAVTSKLEELGIFNREIEKIMDRFD